MQNPSQTNASLTDEEQTLATSSVRFWSRLCLERHVPNIPEFNVLHNRADCGDHFPDILIREHRQLLALRVASVPVDAVVAARHGVEEDVTFGFGRNDRYCEGALIERHDPQHIMV